MRKIDIDDDVYEHIAGNSAIHNDSRLCIRFEASVACTLRNALKQLNWRGNQPNPVRFLDRRGM